jgi:hypothetical protein
VPPGVTNATPTAHLSTTPPTNLVTSSAPPPPSSSSAASSHDKPPPPGPATAAAASSSGGGGSSNPYRIGTGFGSRKPAYGASGIASFSGSGIGSTPPTSQSLSQQPPMMIPSQLLQQPPTAVSQGPGPMLQAPPTFSGPPPGGASLLPSGPPPPPMGSTTAPPLPTAVAGTSQTYTGAVADPQWSGVATAAGGGGGAGGGWDQASQPVRYHWFYLRAGEKYWIPFSLVDSQRLEDSFVQYQNSSQEVRER